jgi:hypothetical protein
MSDCFRIYRSSIRKESGQLDAEPSILNKHYPDSDYDEHFGEEQFYPVSSPPNGEQKFSMSYNKSTRGRPDDLVEMTTCIVEPSISYVVDSCNFSSGLQMDDVPVIDNVGTLANGIKEKVSLPDAARSSMNNGDSASVINQLQHIPTCLPTTATKTTCIPVSENICEDENYDKRSSTHSVSSEEAPSPDYPFLRVSNISLPTAPIKVHPPPMPPSKLLNKRETKENGDSNVNPNSAAAAAAAMKEAMEFAEARLKAAKELMERKGDSFKLRKRPAHHRATKSTEIKGSKISEEVHLFEEKLSMRRLEKEDIQNKDIPLPDNNRDMTAVKSVHCDPDNVILSLGKPQEMPQGGSRLEELGKWTSDAEFYEMIGHDWRCKPNAALSEGNNGVQNSSTKLDQTRKEKAMEFACEPKRIRKLWDTTGPKMETVNLVKDGTSSVKVQRQALRPPEVSFCEENVTDQEPNNTHFKQCAGMDLEGHDDDGRIEISCMNNTSAKVHEDQEIPEKEKAESFAGELKRVRKLWDTTGLKRETVSLLKDGTSSVGVEHEAPRSPEVPFLVERTTYEEPTDEHFKQRQGLESSLEVRDDNHDDDGRFEISCMNNTPAKVQRDTETSSSVSEDSLSGGWHDSKNHSDSSAEETGLVGKSKQDDNTDETMCNSATDQILCDHPNIPNIDEIKEAQVKLSDAEESTKSHDEIEANIHNEIGRANESTLGTLSHEDRKNFRIVENADACEDFQDGDVYQDAGSPDNNASQNEDDKGKDEDKDPYQPQELQGSLRSRDFESRIDTVEHIVSDGEEKEAKGPMVESSEMTLVEEVLNHSSKENKKSMENSIHDSIEISAEVNARSDIDGSMLHSVSEGINDDGSDYAAKMNAWSNSLQASFSEACTRVQYLFQNTGYSAGKADKGIHVKNLLEQDFREADREIPTEKCITVEGQKTGGKMEEKDSEDSIPNMGLKDQHFFHLDSDTVPKFAEDTASDNVHKSKEGNLDVQRTKERDNIKNTEGEVDEEAGHITVGEEKEREWKIENEKEDKERQSRELEEEKERELERAKDRLAVQRATREAHERAFSEARAKAERIALEKITLARQRASAEAREKEKKANTEAAADKASKEARLKAERAAVERATAEARERAIEKAKAAVDAKDRMERFRSSFKDTSKTTNQVMSLYIELLHSSIPDFILGI